MKNFETIKSVAIPKGENREPAEEWLIEQGVEIPDIDRRCLHLEAS